MENYGVLSRTSMGAPLWGKTLGPLPLRRSPQGPFVPRVELAFDFGEGEGALHPSGPWRGAKRQGLPFAEVKRQGSFPSFPDVHWAPWDASDSLRTWTRGLKAGALLRRPQRRGRGANARVPIECNKERVRSESL